MKSFFKKLSLVLVAAMVLTMIPAQNAKAAGAIVLAKQDAKDSTEAITVLMLKKGETQDLKFYGCADWKTTGTGWVSSQEAVATVDKNGVVTAVAAGAAQVCYTATGYTSVPVVVVVADEYTVDIAKQDEVEAVSSITMKAGQEIDFRFLGAKGYDPKKNSCVWTSTNEAVATVDKVGVVKAVADGTAQIVLTIVDKATDTVAFAVQPLDVTVKTEKLEAKQISYNTAKVTFNDVAVDDTVEVVSIQLHTDDTTEIKEYVEVTADGVRFYNDIKNGQKYIFTYKGQTAEFVGNVGELKKFDISYKSKAFAEATAEAGKAYDDTVCEISIGNFRDINDVLVKESEAYMCEFIDFCTYADGSVVETNYYDQDEIYIPEKTAHKVVVNIYNDIDKLVATNSVEFVSIPAPEYEFKFAGIAMGEIGTAYDDCKDNWTLSIEDDDVANNLRALALKFTDIYGNKFECVAGDCNEVALVGAAKGGITEDRLSYVGQIFFESSNPNVLSVTDSGILEPNKEGTATIFCYLEKTFDGTDKTQKVLLAAKSIKVIGKLVPYTMTVKGASNMYAAENGTFARLADAEGACNFNTVTLTFEIKDQLGREMNPSAIVTFKAFDQNKKTALDVAAGDVTAPAGSGLVDAGADRFAYTWTDAKTLKFTADDITAAVENINTRFDITADNGNGKKTATLNVVVGNISGLTDKLQKEVAVYQCKTHGDFTGLGNTDTKGQDKAVVAHFHLIDVYAVAGSFVYGDSINLADVLNIHDIDGAGTDFMAMKASERFAIKSTVEGKVLLDTQVKRNDKKTNDVYAADGLWVYDYAIDGDDIVVTVREKFSDLYDAYEYPYAKYDYAKTLYGITDATVTVDAYRYLNTNTTNVGQTAASWNVRKDAKFDTVTTLTYKNNDEANYASKLTWKNLTYFGDTPSDWTAWVVDHATLTFQWNESLQKKYDKAADLNKDRILELDGLYVYNPTGVNSKYIKSLEVFFKTSSEVVTYHPIVAGVKVSAANYEYKKEDDGLDGEFNW